MCVLALILVSILPCQGFAGTQITGINVVNKPDCVVVSVHGSSPLRMGVLQSSAGIYLGFQFPCTLAVKGSLVGIHSGRISNVKYSSFSANPPISRIVFNTMGHLDYSTQWSSDKTQVNITVWKFGANPKTTPVAQPAARPDANPIIASAPKAAAKTSLDLRRVEPLRASAAPKACEPQGSDPGAPIDSTPKPVIIEPKPKVVELRPKAAATHVARLAPSAPAIHVADAAPSQPAGAGSGKKVSISFLAADINDVLKALAVQSGENIVVGNEVQGTITVTLDGVTVEQALDYITQLSGYTYIKDEHTYLVGSSDTIGGLANAKVDIITLNYTNADDVLEMLKAQCPHVRVSKISVRGGLARKHDQTITQGKSQSDSTGQATINTQGEANVDAQGQATLGSDAKSTNKQASGNTQGATSANAAGRSGKSSNAGVESITSSASSDSPPSDMLALIGPEEKIVEAKRFIAGIEESMKSQSHGKKVSIYPVKYVNTKELANTLMSIAVGVTVSIAPSNETVPSSNNHTGASDSAAKSKLVPMSLVSGETTTRPFDIDGSTSSHTLIIVGKDEDVAKALELAAQFDVPGETELSTYRVKYVDTQQLANTITRIVPGVAVEGLSLSSGNDQSAGSGTAGASSQSTAGTTATVNASSIANMSRTLIITGRKNDVSKAMELAAALDVKSPQIKIEAKITSLDETGEKQLGLSWNWSDFGANEGFTDYNKMTTTNQANPLPSNPKANENIHNVLRPQSQWFRLPWNFSATLDAIMKNGNGKLLASPSLVCLEGKPGQFFVGDEVHYIVLVQQTPQGNNVQTDKANVGVQLTVVGTVSDDGYITMNLHPEVSVVQLSTDKAAGITLPTITRRYTDHVVRVKSGDTIVIGGLIRDQDVYEMAKVPLLGDLPVLGNLFRHSSKTKEHSEVVIFVTASIVND